MLARPWSAGLLGRGLSGPAPGDEWIVGKEIAQGPLGSLGDANPGGLGDAARAVLIVADPESAGWGGEIEAVIAGALDAEGFAEAPRATGEFAEIARAV